MQANCDDSGIPHRRHLKPYCKTALWGTKNLELMKNMVNQVQLIGNLGQDVTCKQLPSGQKIARVSIATRDVYRNDKGEKVANTQWHTLVGWGKVAENMEALFKKGKRVAITGKLHHRSWEDKQGTKHYTTEIWVNEFMLLN